MTMVKSKTIYTTSDGKEYADQIAAQAHQGALDMSDRVHAFVVQKYPKNETAGKKAANIILEWEEWERLQDKAPLSIVPAPTSA